MTRATVVASGLYFGEGPRWRAGRLWFSDFYAHAVKSLDTSGVVRTELEIDDQPSGLGWLPDGRLLVVLVPRHVAAARSGRAHRPNWREASSFMISSVPPPIIITLTSR